MMHAARCWVFAAAAGAFGSATAAADAGACPSPQALAASPDGGRLYVAQKGAKAIGVIDTAAGKLLKAIALAGAPTGLALSGDGATLYVTLDGPAGKLVVVSLPDGTAGDLPVRLGHTPMAPVLSGDGRTLYVCSRFGNAVSVVDLPAGKLAATIPVRREPVAAALTPDGKSLFVANLLPVGRADTDGPAAEVSVISTAEAKVVASIRLPVGSGSVRGICVSPDGKSVYATHILGHFQLPTTQLARGWQNTNAVSILDVAARKRLNTFLLDDLLRGAANPWGIACTPDGRLLCVAHAGTHEVSLIDRRALHAALRQIAETQEKEQAEGFQVGAPHPEYKRPTRSADVPSQLGFLAGLRTRVRLPGAGPRAVAVAGGRLYVGQYFTDDVAVVDPAAGRQVGEAIALGQKAAPTQERLGEKLFHDASLCFQQWQSCASCHPDARSDGLNWDLLNDGIGNPKQAKSMLLAHRTPPAMITGVRASAAVAVRSGIRFIQFAVRPEEDARAIDAYLKHLEPAPSPHRVDGKLTPLAEQGKAVFAKAGCAACHPPPLFTDRRKYDLGMGRHGDKGRAFDTPTLVEAWRTAPYLHDGRADTIMDMLAEHNPDDAHGTTSKLSKQELEALTEYVLSL